MPTGTDTDEAAAATRTMAMNEVVRWGHPVAPRAQTLIVLTDGGQLVTAADWSGGAAVRLKGDDVIVLSGTWDEVKLSKASVSGVVFAQRERPEDREQLVERVRGQPSPGPARLGSPRPSLTGRANSEADVLLLTNGDRLSGELVELERGSLTLHTKAGETKLPLSRVEAIVFGSRQSSVVSHRLSEKEEPSPNPSLKGRGVAVGMRDGSLVYATSIEADEDKVQIELASGLKLAGGSVDDIVALQSLGGPFVYLSDLEPANYRHVPYLSIEWPFARDRDVLGRPLMVDGQRYLKGIGMHSAARLTYRLDENFRRFDAAVAIDDSAKGCGSVTFGVYLERDNQWAEVYKSPVIRGGDSPQPISVDLHGARGLTLTVDYADRGDELDHAVWLDARLVR